MAQNTFTQLNLYLPLLLYMIKQEDIAIKRDILQIALGAPALIIFGLVIHKGGYVYNSNLHAALIIALFCCWFNFLVSGWFFLVRRWPYSFGSLACSALLRMCLIAVVYELQHDVTAMLLVLAILLDISSVKNQNDF